MFREANNFNDLTKEEKQFAIDAVNKKRESDDLHERCETVAMAFFSLLDLCDRLNLDITLVGGRYFYSNQEHLKDLSMWIHTKDSGVTHGMYLRKE